MIRVFTALLARVDGRSRCNALGYNEDQSPALAADAGDTPGEVCGDLPALPSPGGLTQMPDSLFLATLASAVERAAGHAPTVLETTHLLNLADAARDRAAQFAAFESIES